MIPQILGALAWWMLDKREERKRGQKPKRPSVLVRLAICALAILVIVVGFSLSTSSGGLLLTFSALFAVVVIACLISGYQWHRKVGLGCFLPLAVIALVVGLVLVANSYRPSPSYQFDTDYEPKPAIRENPAELEGKHSSKDMWAGFAELNALAEKIEIQRATLDSATSPEERLRAIDALLPNCELALRMAQELINVFKENSDGGYTSHGYVSAAEYRELLSTAQHLEKFIIGKVSELKRDKAALEREREMPQTPDESPEPATFSEMGST